METAITSGEKHSLNLLIEHVVDFYFTLDLAGRYVSVGGTAIDRLAFTPARFLGRTPGEALGTPAAANHEQSHRQALAGEASEFEWSIATIGGRSYLHTTVVPLYNGRDEIVGSVGVTNDVTRLRQVEILRQKLNLARANLTEISQLARATAHRLNNDVTLALGTLELIDLRLDPPSDLRELMEAAVNGLRDVPHHAREIQQAAEARLQALNADQLEAPRR